MTPTPRERGDVLLRGIRTAHPQLWERFMRRIRLLQVDRPETTVRSILAPLIERWIQDQEKG